MKKYIDGILILSSIIIIIILIFNLTLNNQKSINNQKYCLENINNSTSEFWDKKVKDCSNF